MQDQIFTIPALQAAYAAGARPADVVAEVYRRIEAVGDPGIFLHLPPLAELLEAAEALGAYDPTRPLWGIPYVAKDNIDVAGWPTTAACPAFKNVAEKDAFTVALLREAGAIVIGKTNLDQFATGLVGVRTPYPVPKNAIDPLIVPGGSSSGSAVAVAHGVVSFSLGTDTAGSGRVPAGLNNIVGLKPTLGAFSASGMIPACRTLDTISIFALTVSDAHQVFREMTVFDEADAYSRKVLSPPAGGTPPALRVGIPDAGSIRFHGDADQEASFAASVLALRNSGAEIVEIDFQPLYDIAEMLYEGAWVAERHAAIEGLLTASPDAVHPVTRQIVEKALSLSATDAFRGFYRLEELRRAAEPALAGVDLLCVPTFPQFCRVAELEADPIGPNSRLGTYTNFVNLIGYCGLAVPTAPRRDGRPGSVTLLAPGGQDALLATVGASLEQLGPRSLGATGWSVPEVVETPPAATPGELEIAVCGAHMSGMALNGELTTRGGRFLRTADTEPAYRLYALPGGPPLRPGLLQVKPGEGAPIHVEVWALPLDQVGPFLANIPAPLGIGTLSLADGTSPKGFLCEQVATLKAEDVTAIGNWRQVIQRKAV